MLLFIRPVPPLRSGVLINLSTYFSPRTRASAGRVPEMLLRSLARRKGKKRKKKRKKKNRMKLKIQRASVPDISAWVTCCTTGGLAVLVSQIKGATTRTWGVLIQRSLIGGFRGLLSPILFFQSRGYGYCCFARAQPGCGGEEERQGGAGVGWAKWMDGRAEPRRGRGARDVRRVLTYRYSISRDPYINDSSPPRHFKLRDLDFSYHFL